MLNIAIVGFLALASVFVVDVAHDMTVAPSPIPKVMGVQAKPSPSPTPKPKPAVKQTTAMPKVDCTGPDGVRFQTTQKECDEFNAAWGNRGYAPVQQQVQTPPKNDVSTQGGDPGYKCTVCYGSNCSTYYYLYRTKEQCDAAQKSSAAPSIGSYYSPTPYQMTYTTPTPAPTTNPNQRYYDQCISGIGARISSEILSCQIQVGNMGGGDSSAATACNQISDKRGQYERECRTRYGY